MRWFEVEALLLELGARIEEREGSRVLVRLFGERRVFHRPHPSPMTDKGAVAGLRDWLNDNGVKP
ncbi:MAG: type II toxin-antitoxin system HicA family toxin [Methylobacter sp.]|nr:type II toxin-antitoxin system HicA family toxin [Methylobacter sp.]